MDEIDEIKNQIAATKVVRDYLIGILNEHENPAFDREAILRSLKRLVDFYDADIVMLETKLDLL
jgi:hypothetical protein